VQNTRLFLTTFSLHFNNTHFFDQKNKIRKTDKILKLHKWIFENGKDKLK